ncbi:MAG: two-component sensor histidine kinase [Oscillospiraceae bacterium]|jgi:two-component system phosphate regulon sensor histidine kinase PhoR|nr:two-component sensor histidine kinase [Oscillospiraceae bacterium]
MTKRIFRHILLASILMLLASLGILMLALYGTLADARALLPKVSLQMIWPVAAMLLCAVLLSFLLARHLSRRIMEPLNRLDLDKPLENDAYEELSPLLTHIEHQHRQIDTQLAELRRKQGEFAAVTGSMGEGLVLLNDRGVILSINSAAAKLLGTTESCVGSDILTVVRSLAMQKLIAKAQNGGRSEKVMELPAGTYQITAGPVISDGAVAGVCILTFDITERALAEQLRREFSANVSHELKTPLHSIMGLAELMDNGLVKQEDVPRFISKIYSEASRLVTLLDDIIRLSRMDEGGDLPREQVDLFTLVNETAESLAQKAASKKVTLAVQGTSAVVNGVRRLLWEIVYNLCDNAIKYNVDGGRVDVLVEKQGGETLLRVRDTGIGIPPEAHSRVFERFYCVDKSHSKQTGGTGLGLSIVKHAAQYHGAKITLESEVGKGTSIAVRFPG